MFVRDECFNNDHECRNLDSLLAMKEGLECEMNERIGITSFIALDLY